MFRWGMALAALLVLAVACGDGSSRPSDVLEAGQLDIKLPPGWKVTADGAKRPAVPSDAEAAAAPGAATGDTVPLAEEDPSTAFFKSAASFQQCLKDRGTTFRGPPDQSNPDSPANDPAYVKDLSTCAAKSNIVQSMQTMQKAQEDLSPAEIKKQNEGYLRWRKCMIGKGWDIAKPKPDEKGRLFSFGGGGGGASSIKPPPGKDLLSSDDLQKCASETQAAQ
jgi:hypothetical protein